MAWDDVAPTITSGCFNPSKGRFLHPEEDRAITMREAALLQGFPPDYWFPHNKKIAVALMIGNALPPPFIAAHAGCVAGAIRELMPSILGAKVRRDSALTDNLTPTQRSYCMSRIKGKDTGIEKAVRSELHRRGLRFRKHVARLPGKPDVVFTRARVVVFVDGDFWHGYRFPTWEGKVSDFWKVNISQTRARDARNFRKLRQQGWRVIRIWQHDLESDFDASIQRVVSAVRGDVLGLTELESKRPEAGANGRG